MYSLSDFQSFYMELELGKDTKVMVSKKIGKTHWGFFNIFLTFFTGNIKVAQLLVFEQSIALLIFWTLV